MAKKNIPKTGTTTCQLANYKSLVKSLDKMTGVDAKKVIEKCTKDAQNRAPAWVSAAVSEVYTIKKSEVKSSLDGKGRGNSKLKIKGDFVRSVVLIYKGRPLTPTHFKMKPTQRKKKPYRVSVEVFKGKRVNLPEGTFLGKSGKKGTKQIPFQRIGESRYPIKSIKTTSVPQMIGNKQVEPIIQQNIDQGLSKRLENHVKQMLAKAQN